MLLPLLLIPLLSTVLAKQYTLHHRYSTSASGEYAEYGTIDIPEHEGGVVHIEKTPGEALRTEGEGEGWYQLQLYADGRSTGLVTGTKASNLNAGPATLVIHKSHWTPVMVTSIEIWPYVCGPRDGSCPSPSTSASPSTDLIKREVVIKTPHLVYGPDLSPPPPPTPVGVDGKPVPPPEEKSFLQKYWLPLLGVGFFVISQMAPEDNTKGKPAAAAN